MKLNKELGQHFLINQSVIKDLVAASEVGPGDVVLEIGPGTGLVSEEILNAGAYLIAVELDSRLATLLSEDLKSKEYTSFEIINQDALRFMDGIIENDGVYEGSNITRITASIPYQITSPLLHKMTYLSSKLKTCALIIQKEVAERICAVAPNSNYLSSFLQAFFYIRKEKNIGREDFRPIPKVDSAIVQLTPLKNPKLKQEEIKEWSKFLHHVYLQQRKMLNKRFTPETLTKAGIEQSRRAGTLNQEELLKLRLIFQNAY